MRTVADVGVPDQPHIAFIVLSNNVQGKVARQHLQCVSDRLLSASCDSTAFSIEAQDAVSGPPYSSSAVSLLCLNTDTRAAVPGLLSRDVQPDTCNPCTSPKNRVIRTHGI